MALKNKVLFPLLTMALIYVLFVFGKYLYFKPKYIQGDPAPEIVSKLKDGTPFKLSDMKGTFVLIDFWGSWCPPCRKENPDIVSLYDEFNGKKFNNADGFEIVSVAIETKEPRWAAAIEKDKLRWKYHISELNRFDSEIAKSYGVKEIPTKYLLNPSGQIIGVNQSKDEIIKLLSQYLSK